MMKAWTIMTFLMTIIERCAPETLFRAVNIFRNVPVTHYTHNLAVSRGQITPWQWGLLIAQGCHSFHIESPSVECTIVFLLKL